MAFVNGTEAAAERHAADDGNSGQAGSDDVTITIRGSTAARLLGRGDAEDRILTELAGLKQRLDGMEAAAAHRAADDEALRQTVQDLERKVAQWSGQVADQVTELRTELTKLRSAFDSHALSVVHLPGQVERVQGQVGLLQSQVQSQVSPLQSRLTDLQIQLDSLERTVTPPAPPAPIPGDEAPTDSASGPKQPGWLWDKLGQWRQPGKPAANGEAPANASWLKQRLNSLWLW